MAVPPVYFFPPCILDFNQGEGTVVAVRPVVGGCGPDAVALLPYPGVAGPSPESRYTRYDLRRTVNRDAVRGP